MKKGTILYIAVAAALYYYWIKRKKVNGATSQNSIEAASTARQMVANIVDQTTFVPDDTTFAKQYANDQKFCR